MQPMAGTQESLNHVEDYKVGFHKIFLVHLGTKIAARLHGESYTEVHSPCRTELKVVPG